MKDVSNYMHVNYAQGRSGNVISLLLGYTTKHFGFNLNSVSSQCALDKSSIALNMNPSQNL